METRFLSEPDIDVFLEHVARQMAESGRGNTPIFTPYPPGTVWDKESKRKPNLTRWSKALSEPGWGRAWAVFDNGHAVGHIDLRAQDFVTSVHRATIGLGIEESYRGRGLGKHLLETAIAWAKQQNSIHWLDLNVFAHNEAARQLYRKSGFVEVGRVDDLFRIGGRAIDDIQMVLKIHCESR